MKVIVSGVGLELRAEFSNGAIEKHDSVDSLIEQLYMLGVRPEEVTSVDWHTDIDHAPSSGTKIALFHGLRKKYEEAEAVVDNSLGKFVTGQRFMDLVERAVAKARAMPRPHRVEPDSDASASDAKWNITYAPDGTITANSKEAMEWVLENSLIPQLQKRRRREAIDAAIGSVGLSGFKLSPEYIAECERYVRGEIELEDLKAFIDKRA